MTVSLRVRNLWVRSAQSTLVGSASFAARSGELVALVGASGSGKSSVLRGVCGRLARGLTCGADLLEWTLEGAPAGRPLLGRVVTHLPQEAGVALDPYRTVGAQLRAAGARDVEAILGVVGFDPATASRVEASRPHVLSGGMAERAAVAQALARNSPALLCDEPTTGVDRPVRLLVLRALREHADHGHLVVVVTHDLPAITPFADRILTIVAGHLEAA